MKQRSITGPSPVDAAPSNSVAAVASSGKVALKPVQADRYRHRINRAQAEVAKSKGYRKGRGVTEGPKGRFELQ